MSFAARARHRRVGIDNYGLSPLGLSPLDTLGWAVAHGADGVAFSGLPDEQPSGVTAATLADLEAFAQDNGLYLEWGGAQHIPRDMTTWSSKDLFENNLRAAREAQALGTHVVRSCSGGLMRWDAAAPSTETLLADSARALRDQRSMLRDHGVVLAIETHFEFTSFELLRLFAMCEAEPGDWLGICLDTMNLLTMLEHPVSASARLLPWVVSTHIKDGGVMLSGGRLTTFPVPVGAGIIDLREILRMLDTLPRDVTLSVEDHGGSFDLPIEDAAFLGRFPDVTGADMSALINMGEATAARPHCRPIERDTWPAVCESRIAGDLLALRVLSDGVPRETP